MGLREVLGERGRDDALAAAGAHRPRKSPQGRLPVGVVAAIRAWEVEHQQGGVECPATERGEGLDQGRLVAPTEGVVVEGIRHGDHWVHRPRHALDLIRCQRGQHHPCHLGGVGKHARLAPRTAHRTDPGTVERTVHVQQLQRLEQFRNVPGARETQPADKGLGAGFGTGDGCGVAQHRLPTPCRSADLHDDDRHAPLPGTVRQGFVASRRVESFHVQADRTHALVIQEGSRQFGDAELRLVADRDDVGDGKSAPLHGDADGDVGGLRDDGDASFRPRPSPTMLVRPQRHAVEVVDEAIAVGTDDGHSRRRVDQFAL